MLENITETNASIFNELVQQYEKEFAKITGKTPDAEGKYPLDSDWRAPNVGFYWKEDGKMIGFAIKANAGSFSDIAEFYILPVYRGRGRGKVFACAIFDLYPGNWQVRQIEGAGLAREFWRKTIDSYTSGNFSETVENDPYWGQVSCQRFTC
ncbi:MAG: hypothetical protein P0S96_05620 [Simkaniaceae bacterium]|nr:hypothetical protein [Candidatus Sacchlamyda saccharinae]